MSLQLIYITGIINILSILAVIFSCRCMIGRWRMDWMLKNKWYQKFYAYHCWYWAIFIFSVIIHAILALQLFGIPF